jgi:hypothetical protein
MNVRRSLLATLVLAVAGLLAAGLAGPAGASGTASTDIVPEQRFYADSGDPCPMGLTRGLLRWGSLSVSVSGTVVDRPLPSDINTTCGEDGQYTTATFTGYVGATTVATGIGRADNGANPIAFRLGSSRPIDRIVVVVCRHFVPVGPPIVCGASSEYPRP